MEDLSFSTPFEENDFFSFFYDEGEQNQQQQLINDNKGGETILFKDPNAPTYQFTPQPTAMEDFSLANEEQIPSLFPLLDHLKEEPADDSPFEISAPSSPSELEPMEVQVPKGKGRGRRKATPKKEKEPKEPKATKRNATERKNSKRPTKKQKVEKTSFIASLKGKTSTELEQMAEAQSLTPKEQSDLKKYTRMIKNRESAQLSRERRKIYQETLEQALASESERNAALKQQIIELEAENKVLQREFLEFKALIENSNLGRAFSSFSDNNAFKFMTKTAAAGDSQAQATFAMYLLIVLHAFGNQFASAFESQFNPTATAIGAPVEARA